MIWVWIVLGFIVAVILLFGGICIGAYAAYEQASSGRVFSWRGRDYACRLAGGGDYAGAANPPSGGSSGSKEPSIARIKVAFDAGVFDAHIARAIKRNEERNGRKNEG